MSADAGEFEISSVTTFNDAKSASEVMPQFLAVSVVSAEEERAVKLLTGLPLISTDFNEVLPESAEIEVMPLFASSRF